MAQTTIKMKRQRLGVFRDRRNLPFKAKVGHPQVQLGYGVALGIREGKAEILRCAQDDTREMGIDA